MSRFVSTDGKPGKIEQGMVEIPRVNHLRFSMILRAIQFTCLSDQPAYQYFRFFIIEARQATQDFIRHRDFLSTPIRVFKQRQQYGQLYHAFRWSIEIGNISVQITTASNL